MVASSYGNLPKLSLIMAVRNAKHCVARALESVQLQHYPKLELIVWDGMSDDGTQDVLARYSDVITRLVSERDSGPADAFNRSLELVTGDFIGFLNADDELEPGMLWAVAEAVLKEPQAEVVTTGILYRTVNQRGERVVTGYYASPGQLALTLENVLSELPTFWLSRFVRRDLTVKMGPYNCDRALWYISCDREWMARLALTAGHNVIIPKALYGFDSHAKGQSSNPEVFTRIIEEHVMIAESLLARPDITSAQRTVIARWRSRQLVFGFWKALGQLKFPEMKKFFRQGVTLSGPKFYLELLAVLLARGGKCILLKLSRGIDRGE